MATTIINSYRLLEDPFEMVVNTELPGTTTSNQFTLALITGAYNYIVDWGDGVIEEYKDSINRIHTYATPGTYTIKVKGIFPRVYYNNTNDITKIVAINKWGRLGLNQSIQDRSFLGANNLNSLPINKDRFGTVTSFASAWNTCSSLTSFPLINTSNGTSFYGAWISCNSLTSFPLIDTSSGTNFTYTWAFCNSLTSFPLIDTSSGTNFTYTWQGCSSLTSFPLINTSSGTNFVNAWQGCNSLTSFPLIDTSSGTNFFGTWESCTSLTSFPLIDTSSGTSFFRAWQSCNSLTSFPLINTSSGTNFTAAWNGCASLTSFPANFFDNWVGIPVAGCFRTTWNSCNALTSQSVENILVSIDTSGQSASAAWTDDEKKIEIDYNVATGGLSTATTNAITSLKTKNWKPFINGVYV